MIPSNPANEKVARIRARHCKARAMKGVVLMGLRCGGGPPAAAGELHDAWPGMHGGPVGDPRQQAARGYGDSPVSRMSAA